jgi:hypothetical protein
MEQIASPAPGSPAAPDSAARRLVGAFVSPVRTFTAIARRPTWVLPVAIAAALALPLSELILSRTDWRAVTAERIARSGRTVTEAQLDAWVEQMRRLSWLFDIFAVALPAFLAAAVAGVLWAACQAFGWEVRFRQSLGVTAHALLPGTLGSVALLGVLWNRATIDPQSVGDALPTNLGLLVSAHSDRLVHGLLASIDLFSFWTMALLVLGLSAAARTSRVRMAVLVGSLWGLYVLGKAGITALMS